MKYLAAVFFAATLAASMPAYADETEIHSGRLLGHPEFLQCLTDADCMLFTTSTCSMQMAINQNYAAQADQAAAQKLKCVKNFPPQANARVLCSMRECALATTDAPGREEDE